MNVPSPIFRRFKANKQGRVVKLVKPNGKTKKIRLHKCLPKGCSRPRRVCIKCLTNVIHKLDKNYESKICKSCCGVAQLIEAPNC